MARLGADGWLLALCGKFSVWLYGRHAYDLSLVIGIEPDGEAGQSFDGEAIPANIGQFVFRLAGHEQV